VWETRRVRKQYNLLPSAHGFDAWDVDRLVELSAQLPIEDVSLNEISEIDSAYWYLGDGTQPTVRSVAEHARLIEAVDVTFPIILNVDGRVMDGMHRVARALIEGRSSVKAVRFIVEPPPDYRDCDPSTLPY